MLEMSLDKWLDTLANASSRSQETKTDAEV
jgi:hypothetical protein